MSATKIAEVWCDIDGCDNKAQAEDGDNITELRAVLRDTYGWDFRRRWEITSSGRQMIDICADCIERDETL